MNSLHLNNFYSNDVSSPMSSKRKRRNRCTRRWSLVTVRNQLPAQVVVAALLKPGKRSWVPLSARFLDFNQARQSQSGQGHGGPTQGQVSRAAIDQKMLSLARDTHRPGGEFW